MYRFFFFSKIAVNLVQLWWYALLCHRWKVGITVILFHVTCIFEAGTANRRVNSHIVITTF